MKKLSKTIAAAFCAAAALLLIALLVVEGGLKGQMKTIDTVCSSFTHGIYSDYSKCFAVPPNSEKEFDELREEYIREWDEDFHISADFIERKKTDQGCTVYYELTVYNDSSHKTDRKSVNMKKQGGKCIIDS